MKKNICIGLLLGVMALFNGNIAFADLPNATIVNGVVQNTTECYLEPDEYYMTFYKMTLLKERPTVSATTPIDLSSGLTVFENSAGSRLMIKKGELAPLSGTVTVPPAGTYNYVCVELAPMMQLKAHATFNGARTYTNGTNLGNNPTLYSKEIDIYSWADYTTPHTDTNRPISTSLGDWGVTTNYINSVGNYDGQLAAIYSMAEVTSKGENYSVYLVDSAYKFASTAAKGSMGNIHRLMYVLQHPVTITQSTAGISMQANVTQGSSVAMSPQDGKNYITQFMGGPLEFNLTVQ